LNTRVCDAPLSRVAMSPLPSPAAAAVLPVASSQKTVWPTPELFCHVTVEPTATVRVVGVKVATVVQNVAAGQLPPPPPPPPPPPGDVEYPPPPHAAAPRPRKRAPSSQRNRGACIASLCCIHLGADCCAIDLILSMCLSLCEGRPASALALRLPSPGIARRIEIAVPRTAWILRHQSSVGDRAKRSIRLNSREALCKASDYNSSVMCLAAICATPRGRLVERKFELLPLAIGVNHARE
jgi:hypothetical protein